MDKFLGLCPFVCIRAFQPIVKNCTPIFQCRQPNRAEKNARFSRLVIFSHDRYGDLCGLYIPSLCGAWVILVHSLRAALHQKKGRAAASRVPPTGCAPEQALAFLAGCIGPKRPPVTGAIASTRNRNSPFSALAIWRKMRYDKIEYKASFNKGEEGEEDV